MFKGLRGSLQTYCVCLSCFRVICELGLYWQLCSYRGAFVSARGPSEGAGSGPAQGRPLLTYLPSWGLDFYKKLLN